MKSFPMSLLNKGGYVVATYDKCWYISFVAEINIDKEDVKAIFLHPKGPASSFPFPKHKNVCQIPTRYILCYIKFPTLATTKDKYQIFSTTYKKITAAWQVFLKKKF